MAFIFVAKTNGEVLDAVARSQEEHKDIFIRLLISDDGIDENHTHIRI